MPDTLQAKEQVTIPYRVTCITPVEQDQEGTGGGCSSYRSCGRIEYFYVCANGKKGESRITANCFTYTPKCESGEAPSYTGGGSSTVYEGGGSGGSSTSGSAPKSQPIQGAKCFPKPGRDEREPCEEKDTDQNKTTSTGSLVHHLLREYQLDEVDLSVKVPGGTVEARRFYHDGKWHMGPDNRSISFSLSELASDTVFETHWYPVSVYSKGSGWSTVSVVTALNKNGVIYMATEEGIKLEKVYGPSGLEYQRAIPPTTFHHKTYTITGSKGNYTWRSKSGWKKIYENYRLTQISYQGRVIASLQYDANGLPLSFGNRTGQGVIFYDYNAQGLISSAHTGDGRRVEYAYTGRRLASVKDVLGYYTYYEYDDKGRLIKVARPDGEERRIAYDDQDAVVSVLDADNNGLYFDYNYDDTKKEYYVMVTGTSGLIKEFWYDKDGDTRRVDINGDTIEQIVKDGRVQLITDENGNVTRKEYDEWDNLTRMVHPDGSVVTNEYEHTNNRPIKKTDENLIVTSFEYDGNGDLIRKIEAAGTANERTTEYLYDANGNLTTITVRGDVVSVTTMAYDIAGNMTSLTDPEGNVTTFTHDVMGNVLTRTDPENNTSTYTYDDAGNMTSATDPLNHTATYAYDSRGRKISETDPSGLTTQFEYDLRGNLIRQTVVVDPAEPGNNPVTTFEYSADDKLIRQVDPAGHETRYAYGSQGRMIRTTDGNGNTTRIGYQGAGEGGCSTCSGAGGSGQPSSVQFPTFTRGYQYDKRYRKIAENDITGTDIYTTSLVYDPAGNLVLKTDKEDNTTSYEYDALNRLVRVTDAISGTTKYTYDDRDNLVSLTDAENQTTWFAYDRNNWLVSETRPMGEETTYAYDAAGNMVQKIDSKNQKTGYVYDSAGRLATINYFAASTDTDPQKKVTFTYDAVGNLTGYNDGTTSATYAYDAAHRKISETVNFGTFTRTNAYSYYKNGAKHTFTGPDGITYEYLYDASNEFTGVRIPNLGNITVNEYEWTRPASMTYPGGTTKTFAYDPLMRVKQITALDPGANAVLNYQYAYDKMDNITAKTTGHGDYGYGYDDLYRLISADNPDVPGLNDEAFTYDGVGNRLTSAETAGPWAYNQNNELTGHDDVSYEYDANGNTVKKTVNGAVTTYVYNIEDRLSQVWSGEAGTGTLIASYYYDPFGRRLWKDVSGTRTYFHYSDEGLVAEFDAGGNEIKTYGWKPGSTWTTDPLFMKQGGEFCFYHNDHLGTPQKMTAANGAVVWAAKYESFGKAEIDPASTITNNLRFPGQYFDQETGLHYNMWRYYEPGLGRYLRIDPVGFSGKDPILYAYAYHNPIKFIDVFGLKSCTECDECPCGKWSSKAPTSTYGGFLAVVGWDATHLYLECDCAPVTKKIVISCFRLGVGLGGGLSALKYYAWGSCNSSDFDFGGFEAAGGDGYLFIGGTTSASGGIDMGSFSAGGGVGLGGNVSLWGKCRVAEGREIKDMR